MISARLQLALVLREGNTAVPSREWLRVPGDGEQLSSRSSPDGRRERGREMLLFSTLLPASWSVKVASTAHVLILTFLRVMKVLRVLNCLLAFSHNFLQLKEELLVLVPC